MFDTVLVLLDGSPAAEAAIPFGVNEARRHDAVLVLLRVVPRPELPLRSRVPHGGPAPARSEWDGPVLADEERGVRRYLAAVVERFALVPATETVCAVGEPYPRLCEEVERRRRPLVVLSAAERGGKPAHKLDEAALRLEASGVAAVVRVQSVRPAYLVVAPETAGGASPYA